MEDSKLVYGIVLDKDISHPGMVPPRPQTLNPQPSTLNPQPTTSNPRILESSNPRILKFNT